MMLLLPDRRNFPLINVTVVMKQLAAKEPLGTTHMHLRHQRLELLVKLLQVITYKSNT